MNPPQIFFLSMAFSLTTFGLIARWYVVPALCGLPRDRALMPLVLPHCFRYVGLAFLIPGVTAAELPRGFAEPAAYGDLIAAVLALLAAVALRRGSAAGIPLVWIMNLEGTTDFINAFVQGRLNPYRFGDLGTLFFIPTLVVPALMISHVLIFWLLLRRQDAMKS
jgi:hypothetical protein